MNKCYKGILQLFLMTVTWLAQTDDKKRNRVVAMQMNMDTVCLERGGISQWAEVQVV